MITFKVIYSKQKYDVTFSLDATVSSLKSHIETLTSKFVLANVVIFVERQQSININEMIVSR